MGTEIERRFLVRLHLLPDLSKFPVKHIVQAYLGVEPAVRTRIVDDEKGKLTIKGPGRIERAEFEYDVPVADIRELNRFRIGRLIEKDRHLVGRFEVDEFKNIECAGRWIAEIELTAVDEEFDKPLWLGDEITNDPRYSNLELALKGWPIDTEIDEDLTMLVHRSKVKSKLSPELVKLATSQSHGFSDGTRVPRETFIRSPVGVWMLRVGIVAEVVALVWLLWP
jgi:adenylate cyclase